MESLHDLPAKVPKVLGQMDAPSTPAHPISNHDLLHMAAFIFHDLLGTWREKHNLVDKIRQYRLIPLTLDHQDTPIDKCLGPDRLFGMISNHASLAEQNSFTRALLVAFEECNRYIRYDGSVLRAHWLELYRAPYWLDFKAKRTSFANKCNSNISPATFQIILDYTTVLAAKRFLEANKNILMEYLNIPQHRDGSLPPDWAKQALLLNCKEIEKCLFDHLHLLEPNELSLCGLGTGDGVESEDSLT